MIDRVFVIGAYGCGNLGDDALMLHCYRLLRNIFEHDKIIFSCKDHSYLSRFITNIHTIPRDYILNSDTKNALILYGGGTQFYSFPLSSKGSTKKVIINKIIQTIRVPYKIFPYLFNKFIQKTSINHIASLGVGIGPFVEKSIEESSTRKLFKKMEFIAVRDLASTQFCSHWGIDNVFHGTDLCFSQEVLNLTSFRKANVKNEKKIGVIIRDWPHSVDGKNCKKSIIDLVYRLRKLDFQVTHISFSPVYDKEWINSLNKMNESCLLWDPFNNDIENFLSQLNEFNCFLTTRYHGAVFGAILGKPFVCVEVEQKLKLVSDLFCMPLWKKPFNVDDGILQINQIYLNHYEMKRGLIEQVEQQKRLADSMKNAFISYLNNLLSTN